VTVPNVLVWPAGTEIGLEVHRSLAGVRDVCLFGAGRGADNHAPLVFAQYDDLPSVFEPGWLKSLNALIAKRDISMVYPAHDDVILALATQRDQVDAGVVCSPPCTCLITQFKRNTYRHLAGHVRVPVEHTDLGKVQDYPVFIKPDRGQGSHGTEKVSSPQELAVAVERLGGSREAFSAKYLCLEYLPGEEFTVDCFSDRADGLLYVGARQRLRVRNGIAVRSRAVTDPSFGDAAAAIASQLDLHGAWFFQMKRAADGELVLLEVAPRVGGTSGVARARGVNLPLLSLYEQLRRPISIMANELVVEVDRALRSRYVHNLAYGRVYLDLDDTLIQKGSVNTEIVAFVFQCINRGVPVSLLTRHRGDLRSTLARHRLGGLFDEIVHVAEGSEKVDRIDPEGAIFIDDSFKERKAVADRLAIPTFDPSMIEVLLDERA
jgi:hypothetical protein